MTDGKAMIIRLIVGLIQKMLLNEILLYKMSQYFSKPHDRFGENVKVEPGLSNYVTKVDLKGDRGVDTSNLAAKLDLASLKAEVDKIDKDKLKTVPVDLSNLSNVVNNEVVKKTVFDKLAAKVNAIDTSGFVLKSKCDTDKSYLEKKSMKLVLVGF